LLAVSVYWQVGPEWLWGAATGQAVFVDIGVSILFIVVPACYLMILLTDFGFMEFTGTLLRRPFEFMFGLPGRSAIDATASFVSSASVGALITIRQYERGFYTAREACSVATNFSVVSIPFSLVIARAAGIEELYFIWYGTVILACGLCAVLTVRLPPLAGMPDSYHPDTGKQVHEVAHGGGSLLRWAIEQAMQRARQAPGPVLLLREGTRMWLEIMIGILGPALLIATIATIGVFQTPVFDWLTLPLVPLLEFAGLQDAATAAPGFIAGLLDQFTPALIAQRVDNELTRFVLAGLSICQLIFLSELGLILLRSSLPLQLRHLLTIFALRTVIVFPVFLMMGHLLNL
jgi:nucleoside recognition membrane protein YjiH